MPVLRWVMSLPLWCWRCCGPVVIRQRGADVAGADPRSDGDFEFETYYSLSCHNCPDVVQALNLMSVLNPRIKHTAIDGGTFQNEITDRNVMGVPAVFMNGKEFGQGV